MPMHANHVGAVGPLISVGLNVGRLFAARGLGGPPGNYTALIVTAISPTVQHTIRAQVMGRRALQQTGRASVSVDEADLQLKFEGFLAAYPWFDVSAVVRQPATPGVNVLIGQDILSQVVFTWDGPNAQFTVTY